MSRFAYLTELGGESVLAHTDGSWEMLSDFATLADAIDGLRGTDRGHNLGVPHTHLVCVHTVTGEFAVDLTRMLPVGVHDPRHGWRPGLQFVRSALDPLLLVSAPFATRGEAVEMARAAMTTVVSDADSDGGVTGAPAWLVRMLRRLR